MTKKHTHPINWQALSVIVTIAIALIASTFTAYKTITVNTAQLDAFEKRLEQIDNERARNFEDMNEDIRSIRGVLNAIWQTINTNKKSD